MQQNRYTYQAMDASGNPVTGEIIAATESEVSQALGARGLVPLEVEQQSTKASFSFGDPLSTKDIISFTQGLKTLVAAHAPLDRALGLLANASEKPELAQLCNALQKEVKEGKSLSEAMRFFPHYFSPLYTSIVQAGEAGGILDILLPKLGRFLESAEETRRNLISSLTYPAILFLVGILSVVLLLIYVVPQFASMFEDSGSPIPPSAEFLLGLSAFMQQWGWVLLLIPVAVVAGWRFASSTPERQLSRDQMLLNLPLLGGILLETETARLSRTLGALLNAGIPLMQALDVVQGVVSNLFLAASVTQVVEEVRKGTSLGSAFQHSTPFPPLLSQLLKVGEETGTSADILEHIADHFDTQTREQTARLVTLLEPMMILGMGIFVGGIVITMLNAIFSINDVQF